MTYSKTYRCQNHYRGSDCHCLRGNGIVRGIVWVNGFAWIGFVSLNDTDSIDQAFAIIWWNNWNWNSLNRFQVSFSLFIFYYFSAKPPFESSIIFDWSSFDRRFRPESKYVRAGQVLVWPAILVMEHMASSVMLQTLIWHLKVIDSVADEPRVAPVKANCLLNFQNHDFDF